MKKVILWEIFKHPLEPKNHGASFMKLSLLLILLGTIFFTACKGIFVSRDFGENPVNPNSNSQGPTTELPAPTPPPGILGQNVEGLTESCALENISITSCGDQTEISLPSGNTYKLTEIGGMCWFAENLQEIPSEFPVSPEWENNSNNGWYSMIIYTHVRVKAYPEAGYLYTWAAAMNYHQCKGISSTCGLARTQGACPVGWHVPSECEFKTLEAALGMSKLDQDKIIWKDSGAVGLKLKIGGSSKFEAFMTSTVGGSEGSFGNYGYITSFWSSTESSESHAIERLLSHDDTGVFHYPQGQEKSSAYHIRCLKD